MTDRLEENKIENAAAPASLVGRLVGLYKIKGEIMSEQKTLEFYKTFYDENRVRLLHYDNLRLHFNQMVGDVLGKDYYNMGMDVYTCDKICCEDITRKARSFWKSIFSGK